MEGLSCLSLRFGTGEVRKSLSKREARWKKPVARQDGKVRIARSRPSQNTRLLISRAVEIKSDKVDVARFLVSSGLYSHARVGQNGA